MGEPHDFEAMARAIEEEEAMGNEVERAERSLSHALSLARDRLGDRDDVVVEMKAAERGRLELLVDELRSLIDDVDREDHRFEFGLSNGPRPRFWIDATTFVQMGGDRRTYRLVKDRLHDRRLLAETPELELMADAVGAYIADRILDRQRALEGEWEEIRAPAAAAATASAKRETHRRGKDREKDAELGKRGWFASLVVSLLQVAAGLGLVALVAAALVWFFPGYFPG